MNHENIVNAQAPFHQVSAQVFYRYFMIILQCQEYTKAQCQYHPENSCVSACLVETHR